jgi:chorismate-pyruvate lyase
VNVRGDGKIDPAMKAPGDGESDTAYDPFAGVFIAQDEKPAYLHDVDLNTLTPFERACLVIDGTVTRFLEAHRMEPVDIVNCGETDETLKKDHKWLDLPKGERVVSRRVLLKGRTSGRVYASAASLVVPERIKDAVGRPRKRIEEGLGRMLLNGRIEQYRELLWYGREVASDLPGEMRSLSSDESLSRTYRILVRNKPIMMITEWFELDAGEDSA